MEKIEADEAATGDAWYDEEEAMLRQDEACGGGAVADEDDATNASSSTAPTSSAAAGSDAASSTSARAVHASAPAMRKWLALKIGYGTASQNDLERMSKRLSLVQSRPFSTPKHGILVGFLKNTHNTQQLIN